MTNIWRRTWDTISAIWSVKWKLYVALMSVMAIMIILLTMAVVVQHWRLQNNGASVPTLLVKHAVKHVRKRRKHGG